MSFNWFNILPTKRLDLGPVRLFLGMAGLALLVLLFGLPFSGATGAPLLQFATPTPPPRPVATVTTVIHMADHTLAPCFGGGCIGRVAPVNSVLHDLATVTSNDATKTPTGRARFGFYNSRLHCTGTPTSIETIVLTGSGGVTSAESSSTAPLPAGDYSYRAQYVPDAAATALGFVTLFSRCEPLRVQ